jgi:hypothetical protein
MKKPLAFGRRYGGVLLALVPLCFLAAGCGRPKGIVSGKITFQGKALTSGYVTFTPDKGPAVNGNIDGDGNYRVQNVPVGPAKITVSGETGASSETIRNVNPRDPKAMMEGLKPKNSFNLPKKYQNPEESGLTCEVKQGTQEHNLDLK